VNFDPYHHWFYDSRGCVPVIWKGVPCQKFPMDLWVFQEIIWETKPYWIIEVGVAAGGTTCFLSDMLGDARRVIAVDRKPKPESVSDQRFICGNSISPTTLAAVQAHLATHPASCMVILDSDHSYGHVCKELELYAPLVTSGQYLIVEDTNLNGHPVRPGFGSGPYEAVEQFLRAHPEFTVDKSREKFGVTANPNGYLKHTEVL
jgi:cephalosporin hydroxylase